MMVMVMMLVMMMVMMVVVMVVVMVTILIMEDAKDPITCLGITWQVSGPSSSAGLNLQP